MAVIAVTKERRAGETRVAAVPETVKKLVVAGFSVVVEAGAGTAATYPDADYAAAGATLAKTLKDALGKADILFKVRAPEADEIKALKAGAIVVALLNPHVDKTALQALAKELKVDGFMFVIGSFGKSESGLGIGGIFNAPVPVTVGRARAFGLYMIDSYDVNGDVLWRDKVQKESDEAITTVMNVGRFNSLIPKLIDLAKAGSRELVDKLGTQVASR